MKVQNDGASRSLERMKGVAATIATIVPRRQRPLEPPLYLLAKIIVAQEISGPGCSSDGIDGFRIQSILE